MLDSHYRPLARINTEVNESRNTFYAMFLRQLWLGFRLCLGLEFVELTLSQEDPVNVFL
jgi:hypothetical protein